MKETYNNAIKRGFEDKLKLFFKKIDTGFPTVTFFATTFST